MLLLSLFLACSGAPEEAPTKRQKQKNYKILKIMWEKQIQARPKNDGHGEHKGHDHKAAAIDVGEIPAGAKVFFVSPKDGE